MGRVDFAFRDALKVQFGTRGCVFKFSCTVVVLITGAWLVLTFYIGTLASNHSQHLPEHLYLRSRWAEVRY